MTTTLRSRVTSLLAGALATLSLTTGTQTVATPAASALSGGNPIAESRNPVLAAQSPTSLRLYAGTSACSATLLDDHWVLTAAHCVESLRTVRGGMNQIMGITDTGTAVITEGIYALTWDDQDVALVRTVGNLNEHLGPGLRIAEDSPQTGRTVWARGYGTTFDDPTAYQMPATVDAAVFQSLSGPVLSWHTYDDNYIRSGDSGSGLVDNDGQLVSVLGKAADDTSYAHPDETATGAWRLAGGVDLTRFGALTRTLNDYDRVFTHSHALYTAELLAEKTTAEKTTAEENPAAVQPEVMAFTDDSDYWTHTPGQSLLITDVGHDDPIADADRQVAGAKRLINWHARMDGILANRR